MAQLKIEIEGMSCGGCASRITSALQRDSRIEYAVVDFATKTGIVKGSATIDEVQKIVESVGYTIRSDEHKSQEEVDQSAGAELTKAIINLSISAALTMAVVALAMGPWTVEYNPVIQGILTTIFILGPARGFFLRFVKQMARGFVTMDALVSIGIFSAWAISIALVIQGHEHL